MRKAFRFKFEKWWLRRKFFEKIVETIWSSPVEGDKAIDRWQNRVRLLGKRQKVGVLM
jgi:hypothetical protein